MSEPAGILGYEPELLFHACFHGNTFETFAINMNIMIMIVTMATTVTMTTTLLKYYIIMLTLWTIFIITCSYSAQLLKYYTAL